MLNYYKLERHSTDILNLLMFYTDTTIDFEHKRENLNFVLFYTSTSAVNWEIVLFYREKLALFESPSGGIEDNVCIVKFRRGLCFMKIVFFF